jgi:hypothetical protein
MIKNNQIYFHLTIIISYALLSLLMTFPAITVLNTHMIGDSGDGFLNIWNFWFIKEKIIKEDLDIYHTNLQFYPIGTKLFFHTFALKSEELKKPHTEPQKANPPNPDHRQPKDYKTDATEDPEQLKPRAKNLLLPGELTQCSSHSPGEQNVNQAS